LKIIARGENALIRRNLEQVDGTDLLLNTLTTLTVEIIQFGNVIETLTFPHDKLRIGSSDSQAELEVSTDVSAQFVAGKVSARWTVIGESDIFTAEGIQKDIITEDILDVK
jgi:hypothetical protein